MQNRVFLDSSSLKPSVNFRLYLQIRLSSDLVLKLAVCPLQDIYSRLTDVDLQGWRILKDETTGIVKRRRR